jgi:hypothetical protein
MKKNNDLISLNSQILNEISVEELEERLEMGSWGCCDCGPLYGCGDCYTNWDACPNHQPLPPTTHFELSSDIRAVQ